MRRLSPVAAAACAAWLVLAGPAAGAPLQPNDPAWPDQWAQKVVRLPDVWGITTGDPAIVIATIDTGAAALPDLADALVGGWDFVDNDADPTDTNGHGTQVASVIAARGNNGVGMAGHCWQCKVMPVRISAGGSATPDRIAAGINWAVEHGARIINVSVTRPGSPHWAEEAAVRNAIDRGVLVVAGAGNSGNDTPVYPAAYPGVLSVGATDDADGLYFWSNKGSWVDFTAPGCHLVLSIAHPPGTLCGTSFTPAAVAGVAGLMLSRNPGLTIHQVASALAATAKPIPGITFGRINAYAAFEWLGLVPPPGAVVTPPPATTPGGGTTTPGTGAAPRPSARATAAPAQRYRRDQIFDTGSFRRGFRSTFVVGPGRFEAQLLTSRPKECTMSLRSKREVVTAFPAVRNLLSLSVTVAAGRHTVDIRCRGTRDRLFSLGVIAMFPPAGS